MAEPGTIQQIRHRPWLKQPRLEYQADFSFGKVIFGPSFLICNMGGPEIPTCCISTCGASETALRAPKFQLSVFGLSADLFQLAWFKGSLALQSAQLADSESAFLGWNSCRRKRLAIEIEIEIAPVINQLLFAELSLQGVCSCRNACLSTFHLSFFASHIRLWRQHPAAVYVAKIRPFPADLTLVDAAVAYLWPKQPPKAEAAKWPKQLQLQ